MTTHTPGPWHVIDQMLKADGRTVLDQCGYSQCPHCDKQGDEKPSVIQITGKGWGVAQLGSYDPKKEHDQHMANAHLIAAAPDLLAALKWAEEYLGGWPADNLQRQCREAARAAIAKAEGKQ